MKPELMINAPRGSWADCHESGWIQKEIFTSWFRKFIVFSRASKEKPVLLILDGHASHTKNLDIIDLGREHGVHILATPPHCTHRLQPLDVGFMKPLSTLICYTEASQNWLKSNCGRIITQFQIPELVDKAFQKAATMSTAFNAFRATGIWPLNRDIFTEADFLAAAATDIAVACDSSVASTSDTRQEDNNSSIQRPQPSTSRADNVLATNINETQPLEDTNATRLTAKDPDITVSSPSMLDDSHHENLSSTSLTASAILYAEDIVDEPQPSTSMATKNVVKESAFLVGSKDITPIPITTKTKRANIRRGKTAIITSSPYRLELETSQNKKADQVKKGLFRDDETPKKRKAATKGKKSLVKGSKKKMTKYKNDIPYKYHRKAKLVKKVI